MRVGKLILLRTNDMQISDIKDLLPVLAAIIAAGAALCGVAVTNFFNIKVSRMNLETQIKQKSKDLRIQKIEELFLLFDKWCVDFSNYYFVHYRCYLGKISYAETLDIVVKKNNTLLAPGETQKYKMLIDLYFPSLSEDYQAIEKARKAIAPYFSDPRQSGLNASDFKKLQIDFEREVQIFKSKIRDLAHEII